jgi:hypothetical protein
LMIGTTSRSRPCGRGGISCPRSASTKRIDRIGDGGVELGDNVFWSADIRSPILGPAAWQTNDGRQFANDLRSGRK